MATRKEVAELAQVSVSIVSRVMNQSGYVAESKRQAVLQAAKALNYNPDPLAVSLKTRKTRQLLYYYPDILNCFNMDLYNGMVSCASQYGYMVVISGILDFEQINGLMTDGVILPNEYYAKKHFVECLTVPAVSAGFGGRCDVDIPLIEVDTGKAVAMLIEYLREKGHSRIAFVTPYIWNDQTPRHIAYIENMEPVYQERLPQYVITAMQEGLGAVGGENFFRDGRRCADIFVDRKLDATAAICFNDDIAIGFINRLKELGKKVPEDISVASIDGHSISRQTFPELTCVQIPAFDQGYECVRTLIEILEKRKLPEEKELQLSLLKGKSVINN